MSQYNRNYSNNNNHNSGGNRGNGRNNYNNNNNNYNNYRYNNNNNNNSRYGNNRRRYSNNNKNDSRRNRNNNNNNARLPELAPPALTYEKSNDKQKRVKLSITTGRVEQKVELPIFDDTTATDYLRTVVEYENLLRRIPALNEDNNTVQSHHCMLGALRGEAQSAYLEECEDYTDATPATRDEFRDALQEASRAVLGEDAFDNQVTYLKKTRKPKDISVEEWSERNYIHTTGSKFTALL